MQKSGDGVNYGVKNILLISLIIISSCSNKSESDLLNKENPDGKYGLKISLTNYNSINDLLNSPNKYLGQDVLVTGEIMEVCPMRGCWINVKDPNSDSNIRVKVTDGQIVFPLSSKGRSVNIQGEFSQLNFTEDQAIKWKVHLAEEKGIILNPDDIIINQSDLVEYRIIGKGAKIYPYGCN